jgi:phosphoribosylcarboxyaminoimidazole (NCAIR) mutase
MRANSRCESKFFCGSLSQVSKPSVILFGDGPAARVLLQKTASVLAAFPEIRVQIVNKSVATVSNAIRKLLAEPCIGIFATSRPAGVAKVMAGFEPNPLIVVPVAARQGAGLRLLQAAAQSGAPTVALGEAGARNAALLAVAMFAARGAKKTRQALDAFRAKQTSGVLKTQLPAV